MGASDGWREAVEGGVAAVRARRPLVHCIVAAVTMQRVADGLLAAGARPMMTETAAEAPVLVAGADALLVNLGTLSEDGGRGIPVTVAAAREAGVPWVLDPTAVGVAPVRTPLAVSLLGQRPAVVRGNASEVLVVHAGGGDGRGPDTTVDVDGAVPAAREIARRCGAVVAVSGPSDAITDGDRLVRVPDGDPLLGRVTGTGCLLGALTAACLGASSPGDQAPWRAALAATAWLVVAADVAATRARRPGSFVVALLDALDEVSAADVAGRVRLTG